MKVGDRQRKSEENRRHYEKHKEKIQERHKDYRERPETKEKKRLYAESWRTTPRGKYTWYKSKAKQRGILLELTFEEFESFWQKPCGYCGAFIETIGLDRVDNDKGYLYENVTSCCIGCNISKGTKPLSEWLGRNQCKSVT